MPSVPLRNVLRRMKLGVNAYRYPLHFRAGRAGARPELGGKRRVMDQHGAL
jgi:hypothetical protein